MTVATFAEPFTGTPIYRALLDGGLGDVLYELRWTVVNRRALFARWWKEGP